MPPTSRLKAPLEQLCREADWARRIDRDAIRYPLRYRDPADREIVALLSACLAYGRVDLFGPWIEWALGAKRAQAGSLVPKPCDASPPAV